MLLLLLLPPPHFEMYTCAVVLCCTADHSWKWNSRFRTCTLTFFSFFYFGPRLHLKSDLQLIYLRWAHVHHHFQLQQHLQNNTTSTHSQSVPSACPSDPWTNAGPACSYWGGGRWASGGRGVAEQEKEVLAEHGGAGSGLFSGLNSIHRISITKASSAAGRRDPRAWPGKHRRKWIHWSDLPPPPPLHPAFSTPSSSTTPPSSHTRPPRVAAYQEPGPQIGSLFYHADQMTTEANPEGHN